MIQKLFVLFALGLFTVSLFGCTYADIVQQDKTGKIPTEQSNSDNENGEDNGHDGVMILE